MLNKEKCKFAVSEVTYIGCKLTPKGVHPDPEKVTAIGKIPAPTDESCRIIVGNNQLPGQIHPRHVH